MVTDGKVMYTSIYFDSKIISERSRWSDVDTRDKNKTLGKIWLGGGRINRVNNNLQYHTLHLTILYCAKAPRFAWNPHHASPSVIGYVIVWDFNYRGIGEINVNKSVNQQLVIIITKLRENGSRRENSNFVG